MLSHTPQDSGIQLFSQTEPVPNIAKLSTERRNLNGISQHRVMLKLNDSCLITEHTSAGLQHADSAVHTASKTRSYIQVLTLQHLSGDVTECVLKNE